MQQYSYACDGSIIYPDEEWDNKIYWDYDYMLFRGISTSDYYKDNRDNPDVALIENVDAILSHINKIDEETIQPFLWQRKEVIRVLSIKDDRKQYHRHKFYPDYKSNRIIKTKTTNSVLQDKVKKCIDYIKNILILDPKFRYIKGVEADDIIGFLGRLSDIVIGQDKDLQTISGILFYDTYRNLVIPTTDKSSTYFTQYQMVVGDSADGYKGIPKIGDVGFSKYFGDTALDWYSFISIYVDLCRNCKDDYIKNYPYTYMVTMYKLSHMLTAEEYDIETNKVHYKYPFIYTDEDGSPKDV
jgi:hypothetical protein